jgi:hypothetical protein
MGGIEQLTNGMLINWDGPSGYYQVFQKSNSLTAPWVALGQATNLVRYAVITKLYSNAFFSRIRSRTEICRHEGLRHLPFEHLPI